MQVFESVTTLMCVHVCSRDFFLKSCSPWFSSPSHPPFLASRSGIYVIMYPICSSKFSIAL